MEQDESIPCIVPSVTLVSETALALVHMVVGLCSQKSPCISYLTNKAQFHKILS